MQHCVNYFQNDDMAVHNLLLTLYAQQENDADLLQFLNNEVTWLVQTGQVFNISFFFCE